ncbi:MAG TPA: hypothetical protein PKI60_06940 [Oscillospiraceae bacterium]|nr:hypothetical protein [Oscillospiraceae bacterium]
MAYQVKRLKKIEDAIELLNNDGSVAKVISVNLTVEDIALQINKARNDIISAQLFIKKAGIEQISEAQEQLGTAVISLFNLVFGEQQTAEILDFYENNYSEMITCIFPFISDVIFPAIAEAAKERKELVAKSFNLNRTNRRKLGI